MSLVVPPSPVVESWRPAAELHRIVERKLRLLGVDSAADIAAINCLGLFPATLRKGQSIVVEGEPIEWCCLLTEGHAIRSRVMPNGNRQIVSLHPPGDFIDLQHLLVSRADHSVEAITDAQVIRINKTALIALTENHPAIARALWRETLIEAARFREWIANIGRREAVERVAFLLCEFVSRFQPAGELPLVFPMTQTHVADATGLTPVHVNRVLRRLKESNAIDIRRGHILINDSKSLKAVAHFDPTYLHASNRAGAAGFSDLLL